MNTFLLIGDAKPQVHTLTAQQVSVMQTRLGIAGDSLKARIDTYRLTFGVAGVRYAVPAYPVALESVALEIPAVQLGEHAETVKAYAAALLLEAICIDDPSSRTRQLVAMPDNGDGGDPVLKPTAPPRSPSPAVKIPLALATAVMNGSV